MKYKRQFESFEWNGITVDGGGINYCLLCIYRKQEIAISEFLQHLSVLLDNVFFQCTDELIIMGDFNVHFETSDKSSVDLSDLLSQFGLSQM